jgi:hypothetical protein
MKHRSKKMSDPSVLAHRVRVLDQNDPIKVPEGAGHWHQIPRPVEEVESDWNKSLYWEDPKITAARMTRYGISVIDCLTFGSFQAPTLSLPENIVEGIVEPNNVEDVLQRTPL